MLTEKDLIQKIKSDFFDVASLIHNQSRSELINVLLMKIKDLLNVSYVGLYLYDKWKKDEKLKSFDDEGSLYFAALLTDKFYIEEMKGKLTTHVVLPLEAFTNEKLTNKEIYVLRIQPEHEPDG